MKNCYFYLIILFVIHDHQFKKCSHNQDDYEEQTHLKMVIYLGSSNLFTLSELDLKTPNLESDDFILLKDKGEKITWMYVLGNQLLKKPLNRDEILNIMKDNSDVNNLDIDKLNYFNTFLRNKTYSDCHTIYEIIDRFFHFYYELFIYNYPKLQLITQNENELIEDPFHLYQGFQIVNNTFRSGVYNDFEVKKNFINIINNENSLEKLREIPRESINSLIRSFINEPDLEDIFNIEDENIKSRIMKQVGKFLTFFEDEVNVHTLNQMKISFFPIFYKNLLIHGNLATKEEKSVFNFLIQFQNIPELCQDKGIFKKVLCQAMVSRKCNEKTVSEEAFSLALLTLEYLDKLFYDQFDTNKDDDKAEGLKTRLIISSIENLKKVFNKLTKLNQTIADSYTCLFKDIEGFKKDFVLFSFLDKTGKLSDNSNYKAGDFVESIWNPKKNFSLKEIFQLNPHDRIDDIFSDECTDCVYIESRCYKHINFKNFDINIKNEALRLLYTREFLHKEIGWFYSMKNEEIFTDLPLILESDKNTNLEAVDEKIKPESNNHED